MIRKLNIGNVVLDNPLILAPMAGVTDLPFRLLCKEQGAGLVCMEMVSAKALTMGDKKSPLLMTGGGGSAPFGIQLFGHEPDVMAEAAAMIAGGKYHVPFDFLDINMGCPAPKITGPGAGSSISALMRAARSSASPGSGVTCSCGRNTLEPLAVVDNTLSPQANASSTALEQAS